MVVPPVAVAAAFNIVVTGRYGPEHEFAPLRVAGHRLRFGPSIMDRTVPLPEADLMALAREADVLMPASRDLVTGRVLAASDRLRAVVAPYIGVDRIDLAAATRRGILVANSPCEENFVGVAEATIGAALMLLKRVRPIETKLRAGAWRAPADYGDLLAGKTVGIVGVGRVGSEVAQRLAAWRVRLIGHDPYVPDDRFLDLAIDRVSYDELLRQSDIVTFHVVLTEETKGMLGRPELAAMKPTAIVINTARGAVLDEDALCRALAAGAIGGAALDTFGTEPLPASSELRDIDADRLVLTPHCIGQSEAARAAMWKMGIDSVGIVAAGRLPDHVVNPDVLPSWRRRFDVTG